MNRWSKGQKYDITRLLNFTFQSTARYLSLDGAFFFFNFLYILGNNLILNFIQKFILFAFFTETYREMNYFPGSGLLTRW